MNKIKAENYEDIFPYSCARKEILNYWHDQAWLIRRPYFYEIIDDVLYIHKKIYYQETSFLAMPPMTLDNDYEKEYYLLKQHDGVVALSSENVRTYKNFATTTPFKFFKIRKTQSEWIYNTETYRPENLTGKKNRKWRNAVNKLEKDGYSFRFVKYDRQCIMQRLHYRNVSKEMRDLTNAWLVETDKKDSTKYFWIDLLPRLKNAHMMLLRDKDKKLVGFNITQKLGNTVIYSCEKMSHSEFGNFPVMKAVHIKLSEFYRAELNSDIFLNKGCEVSDKGIQENKNLLRAYKKIDLFKTIPEG